MKFIRENKSKWKLVFNKYHPYMFPWLKEDRENFIFESTFDFNIANYNRSNKSVYLNVKDTNGDKFHIGANGMFEVIVAIQNGILILKDGKITGLWTFAKQGTEYYIIPYKEK